MFDNTMIELSKYKQHKFINIIIKYNNEYIKLIEQEELLKYIDSCENNNYITTQDIINYINNYQNHNMKDIINIKCNVRHCVSQATYGINNATHCNLHKLNNMTRK